MEHHVHDVASVVLLVSPFLSFLFVHWLLYCLVVLNVYRVIRGIMRPSIPQTGLPYFLLWLCCKKITTLTWSATFPVVWIRPGGIFYIPLHLLRIEKAFTTISDKVTCTGVVSFCSLCTIIHSSALVTFLPKTHTVLKASRYAVLDCTIPSSVVNLTPLYVTSITLFKSIFFIVRWMNLVFV